MNKKLSFNTVTGELEYMGYSISIKHGVYEEDCSYVEYGATRIDGKDWNIVEESLGSLINVIETRVNLMCEE